MGSLSRYSYGLRAGRPGFDSRQEIDFSLLHSVQTGSGAQPASHPMGTRDLSPRVKGRCVKLTTHLHLVPRSRMVELHHQS
jgi:hypothetical protein